MILHVHVYTMAHQCGVLYQPPRGHKFPNDVNVHKQAFLASLVMM